MSVDIQQLIIIVTILWFVLGFFCGSLVWSHWISGRFGRSRTTWLVGALLDALTGAVFVLIVKYVLLLDGWPLVLVALTPILGHAFSPFAHFHGGKAVAVAVGVYAALSAWTVILFGAILLGVWSLIVVRRGWRLALTGACLLVVFLITDRDPIVLPLLALNLLVILWNSRGGLRNPPGLRDWITRRLPSRR